MPATSSCACRRLGADLVNLAIATGVMPFEIRRGALKLNVEDAP